MPIEVASYLDVTVTLPDISDREVFGFAIKGFASPSEIEAEGEGFNLGELQFTKIHSDFSKSFFQKIDITQYLKLEQDEDDPPPAIKILHLITYFEAPSCRGNVNTVLDRVTCEIDTLGLREINVAFDMMDMEVTGTISPVSLWGNELD